jgi:NhaP-type Na+/H+ or K+/H+ antiporter
MSQDSASADSTMEKSVNFMLKFIGSFIVVIIGGVLGIVGSKKAPSQMKPIILGILTYISGWVLFPLNNYVAAAIYLVAGLLLVLAGLTTKIQIENQTKEDEKRKKMMLALISIGIMLLVTIGGCFMLTSNPKKQTDIKNETTLEENDLSELEQDTIDESQIIDYSVEKISGSHKYGGATDIEYKSLAQLIDETTKKSEKEMWGKEQLERRINSLRNSAIGGRIILEIERKTLEEAKTNQYTFIIKDLDENEIYRKRFESTETP